MAFSSCDKLYMYDADWTPPGLYAVQPFNSHVVCTFEISKTAFKTNSADSYQREQWTDWLLTGDSRGPSHICAYFIINMYLVPKWLIFPTETTCTIYKCWLNTCRDKSNIKSSNIKNEASTPPPPNYSEIIVTNRMYLAVNSLKTTGTCGW